jgi:hypothetical protein
MALADAASTASSTRVLWWPWRSASIVVHMCFHGPR